MRAALPASLLVSACAWHPGPPPSSLPDFAAPSVTVDHDPASLLGRDLIPYRTLARDDFRAVALPPERAAHAEQMGAFTCARFYTSPDGRILAEPEAPHAGPRGKIRYAARIVDMRVEARMDRGCSWWNPNAPPSFSAYLLQHEQIHFGLVELAARQLDAELAALGSETLVTASTPEEALERSKRKLEALVRAASERLVARQRAFDEDTSVRHSPAAQERWWSELQADLAATANGAAGALQETAVPAGPRP